MSNIQHRPGVSEVNLVARHLALDISAACAGDVDQFLGAVDSLDGIDEIDYDAKTQRLNLSYDATHLSLQKVEKLLQEYHLAIRDNWWNKLKTGYYEFVDTNVKSNAEHQPSCCHGQQHPPKSD